MNEIIIRNSTAKNLQLRQMIIRFLLSKLRVILHVPYSIHALLRYVVKFM